MNARDELGAQRRMHRAVPRQARLPLERVRAHPNSEVAAATLPVSGMSAVKFTFINNFKVLRPEFALKRGFDLV